MLRLRRDAYVSPATPEPLRRALAVGGQLACVSALVLRGAWCPPDSGIHVCVDPHATRLNRASVSRSRLTLHWTRRENPTPVASVDESIRQMLQCQPRRMCIAVLDSTLRAGLITSDALDRLSFVVPASRRVLPHELDPSAESGIESLVRVSLRDAGLEVESQVQLPGIGRVDLLVEGRVIVEVDGREWHRGEQVRDYRRDLEACRQGFRVVRVDYLHALMEASLVVEAVMRSLSAATASGGVTFLRNRAR